VEIAARVLVVHVVASVEHEEATQIDPTDFTPAKEKPNDGNGSRKKTNDSSSGP